VDKSVDDLWAALGTTAMIWGQAVDGVWTAVRRSVEGRIKLVEKLWRSPMIRWTARWITRVDLGTAGGRRPEWIEPVDGSGVCHQIHPQSAHRPTTEVTCADAGFPQNPQDL
jgi:hypothetical protein